ncbi:Undecaprenyl-phosphate galactose phosphotransferase WbaP/exopolysaccharide biosynthesis polyprenyl glycosylphosphotransferase [Motilibacter peucedani]|uniref:Undecaprenyl-phosphate galactose phosphotransferase WbaP/exopolysaccharide biosynthesis polyprenyl glycosylphosphotransferase n=1 Tax=Motilibacter peucedani TaxID=598650 RepID=A0A420XKT0_9ACTN|nr:sugar transferase [Motilibacter peucedani]RKS68620.1 Undecaprenyl-phosphate galactose phosphotransferase WbaP/exopolysaccharide biosynthesis polyprenyl glycosylphosphotransferase [Motilibacter peucedani]
MPTQQELVAARADDRPTLVHRPSVPDDRPVLVPEPARPWGDHVLGAGTRLPRAWQRRYTAAVVASDAAAAVVISLVLVAYLLHRDSGSGAVAVGGLLAFPAVWMASLAVGRCYEERFLLSGGEAFKRLSDTGLRLLAVAAVVAALSEGTAARLVALVAVPLALLAGAVARAVGRARLHALRAKGAAMHRVVVVGSAAAVAEMVRLCRTDSTSGFSFVGALVDGPAVAGAELEGVPVLGEPSAAGSLVASSGADTLLVASGVDAEALTRLCWLVEGLGADVFVAPNLSGVSGPRLSVHPVGGVPLLHVDEPELSGPRRLLKSLFDRTMAAAGLLALLPVLAAVALAVKLDSRGPVVFKQVRVGKAGTPFTMWKFRSMVPDAERRRTEIEHLNDHGDDHVLFKMKDDPRITRVGKFLRRYSLDELPQLVNVLRGEMSLVGPRPPLPSEVERYADSSTRRLLVRPGLTGLWQVSGRSDLSWEESLRLDLHYVENWSLFFDLHILWKTGSAVLGRSGAY